MNPDLILVGGGLANSLIAWRLLMDDPEIRLLMLESGSSLGGNHTWCFHTTDITPEQHRWVSPLVVHQWPCHEVRFPAFQRQLSGGYHMLTSEHLDARLRERLGDRVRLEATVDRVSPREVVLASGEKFQAKGVIDGRGPLEGGGLDVRYQKFLGRVIALESDHGLLGPVIMDATVAQSDGYRFVYILPLGPDLVLVEDTYYSDSSELNETDVRSAIDSYVEAQGWRIRSQVREERGVLPVALGGDINRFWCLGDAGVPRSGLRAALFHPVTGYSLPQAVALADTVAGARDLRSETLFRLVREQSIENWRGGRFFRLLNRMLFLAARPERRYRILQRFYGLSEPLIQRFYASHLTLMDKIRLLAGKPPISPLAAVHALLTYRSPPDGNPVV